MSFLASGGITKGGKIQLLAGKLFYQWGEVSYDRYGPCQLYDLGAYTEPFSEKGNVMKKYSRHMFKKWFCLR